MNPVCDLYLLYLTACSLELVNLLEPALLTEKKHSRETCLPLMLLKFKISPVHVSNKTSWGNLNRHNFYRIFG